MERVVRITMESSWIRPNELSRHQIDIVRYSNGSYFSKFEKLDHAGKVVTIKNELPEVTVADILELLLTVHIPAFPRHMMGCDGGFTEIEVRDGGGSSHFRWWSDPPNGWEQLDQVTEKIVQYCGFYDPMDLCRNVKGDESPTHEFRPLCAECGEVASTFLLFDELSTWRLVFQGSAAGNGSSGDEITAKRARAIIAGFTEPYFPQRIRAAGFFDDGGYCLECCQFYCPKHWHISTTGGGTCPQGHFKSLDPHWSPDSDDF